MRLDAPYKFNDMTQSIIFTLFGLGLFMVAVRLMRRQLKARQSLHKAQQSLRKKTPDDETAPLEVRFNAAQCRRRIQCGVLLAALALGMIAESWITSEVARVALGAAMLILLGWMILLAFFDILATTTHYRRMADRYRNEQMRLEARVKKIFNDDEKTV